MLMPDKLHDYEVKAIEFQCSRPASALWLDMGLGKTIITLTSILWLIRAGHLHGVVIVAPIRVCRMVWRQEAAKWAHTVGLKFALVVGDHDRRCRELMQPADVFLVNYENLEWLSGALQTYFINQHKPLPFDGIVYDEITKCKNSSTRRVHALAKILPYFKWRTGLTGSPASNGYKDLHGQYLVLDDGERLGTSKTQFETRYYKKNGTFQRKVPYEDTEETIRNRIGDITLEMSAEDYNKLPDIIINDVMVELPGDLRTTYEVMEQELFLKLDSGAEVELFNQASLMNKCLQFANGAAYTTPGMPEWEAIHELKLDALEEILEEANGQPILCGYQFKFDAERIMQRFHKLHPINLSACHSDKSLNDAMRRWQEGDCPLLIGHPGSMGHGLDGLQKRGNIVVWFGLTWSLDLYDQLNARIRRQGQGHPVIVHRILCADTFDEAQAIALEDKGATQASLRKAIKKYRQQKT